MRLRSVKTNIAAATVLFGSCAALPHVTSTEKTHLSSVIDEDLEVDLFLQDQTKKCRTDIRKTVASQLEAKSAVCITAQIDDNDCRSIDINRTFNKCIPGHVDLLRCIKSESEKPSVQTPVAEGNNGQDREKEYNDCIKELSGAQKTLGRIEKITSVLELEEEAEAIIKKLEDSGLKFDSWSNRRRNLSIVMTEIGKNLKNSIPLNERIEQLKLLTLLEDIGNKLTILRRTAK